MMYHLDIHVTNIDFIPRIIRKQGDFIFHETDSLYYKHEGPEIIILILCKNENCKKNLDPSILDIWLSNIDLFPKVIRTKIMKIWVH